MNVLYAKTGRYISRHASKGIKSFVRQRLAVAVVASIPGLIAGLTTPASADVTANWTSTSSGNWSSSSWSTAHYPNDGTPTGTDYDVTIKKAVTVTQDVDAVVDAVALSSDGNLTIGNTENESPVPTFTGGTVTVNSGSTYTAYSGEIDNTTFNLSSGGGL